MPSRSLTCIIFISIQNNEIALKLRPRIMVDTRGSHFEDLRQPRVIEHTCRRSCHPRMQQHDQKLAITPNATCL